MAEKKADFVVSDRRKFTEEGDLRSDVRQESVETSPSPNTAVAEDAMPEAPSHAEQEQQGREYAATGKKLDDMLSQGGHGKAEDFEMTFDRLVQSLYVTAMVQLGIMHREGETPRPDIIGARQTIDTLAVLKDKTKGNLTKQEENLLQNVLFELRMAFLEMTNALTRPPAPAEGESQVR
ncbi:MAG: DUF1844 domain-containing protein [Acidobacteria bacterium]|nr:DUF1844 domain-containing protein [Acidobacteriota bacterium]MBV9146345.1 DUF1844 domain-containing protein [Acidobacteriota bacterium]MBV9436648.1 DUF1844 domain-containing protein [Acidobacteriota bacterium]